MKSVLFVIPSLAHGGAEKVLVNLVNNLDVNKFDVTILVLFAGGVNEQFLKKHIKVIHCFKKAFPGNSRIMKLFSPKFLFSRFIRNHYDIIVSYLEGPAARIVSGCTDKNTRLVGWIHCKMENEIEASVGFRNFSEAKYSYNLFDNIVCVSKMTMDFFVRTFSFSKPIEVLYNTIETDEVYKKSLDIVDDIVFREDTFNLCSVGKITKVKGFDRLARIHKKLINDEINNHVYIFGVGEQKDEIEKYLIDNNLTETFTFAGYRTNPYKYVANCDLYICSSISEGFSTSVTESLIVGTPVVTTNVSGMVEMLGENNEYGIITDNTEDDLYNGIKKILTDKDLLTHYKLRAKERADFFSKEKTIRAVEAMLESL